VLKTSSGKIRRAACRALYEQGRLGLTQRAPWRQWLALALEAAAARARSTHRSAALWAWGLWAWAVFVALGVLAWSAVMLMPSLNLRRRAAWKLARLATHLIRLPVQVQGLDRLPPHCACIVVANHASYVDAILLGAMLPPDFSFVAKRELADTAFIGRALRRLGAVFVERFEVAQGVDDTRTLQARVRAGESLVLFPEGTFGRATGLQPFKLGAFVAAAETATPLVPVTLNGTRSLLRDESWLPRRQAVQVLIGAPITPAGKGWQHALDLRDAARKAIELGLTETSREF